MGVAPSSSAAGGAAAGGAGAAAVAGAAGVVDNELERELMHLCAEVRDGLYCECIG